MTTVTVRTIDSDGGDGKILGYLTDDGGKPHGTTAAAAGLLLGGDPAQAFARYARGWSNGYVETVTTKAGKGHPHPGQRYHHGWIPIAESILPTTHHGEFVTSLHPEGHIHFGGEHHTLPPLHTEDTPSVVEAIDNALTDLDNGQHHESTTLTSVGDLTITARPDTGLRLHLGDGELHLSPTEAEQFAAHLDDLAAAHHPGTLLSYDITHGVAADLLTNDRIGFRLGGGATIEPGTLDADDATDIADGLAALGSQPVTPPTGDDPLAIVASRRVRPGLELHRWSDNSASLTIDNPGGGTTEIQVPGAHVGNLVAVLQDMAARLGPALTAKGARLVRKLARAMLTKDHEGDVGEYRARHLIRWYNTGADGQIPWGADGDFDACVAVAARHMSPKRAKGFCNLRHKDALGFYPATHAAMERGHK